MQRSFRKRSLFFAILAMIAVPCLAQKQTNNSPGLPFTTQVKKTVVFLTTSCLHSFAQDVTQLTEEQVKKMPLNQQQLVAQRVQDLLRKLEDVPLSMSKLTKEEQTYASQNVPLQSIRLEQLPDYIVWRINAIVKMTDLSEEELAGLKEEELRLIPSDDYQGTGFFASYPDARIPPADPAKPETRAFTYLVTNHHVVEPGIEHDKPCKRMETTILLNHKPDDRHKSAYTENDRIDTILKWVFPEDKSVDLAAAPIGAPETSYDYTTIPTTVFVSDDEIKDKKVIEGESVIFAGLFIQSFREAHTLEPIVRSGSLAMLPEGLLQTTMNDRNGHIYLTEAHAFGGNSGSPVFVDERKFTGGLGYEYKLLGVISGEIFENADLTMTVATTVAGNVAANSDVSIVVPANEIRRLLDEHDLTARRDASIRSLTTPPPADFKKKQ